MPKTQINESAVFQVCDEVYVSTGKDPSYEDVKNTLGGSYSTIRPYIQSWLDKPRPPRFPLPDAIGTKAAHLAQVIWGYALADARQMAEAQQQKANEALALSKKELEIAIQEIRDLENERARLSASVDSLVAERAELKAARARTGDWQQVTYGDALAAARAIGQALLVEGVFAEDGDWPLGAQAAVGRAMNKRPGSISAQWISRSVMRWACSKRSWSARR